MTGNTSSLLNETECLEWPSLNRLTEIYAPIHSYLALTVCLFGSATNILNAIVLTQASMRNPSNALLTGVALVDTLTMLAYGMQTVYLNLLTSPRPETYPHSAIMVHLVLLQNVLSIGSHTISTSLLVQLAAFRCWILYTCGSTARSRTTAGVGARAQRRTVTYGFIGATLFGLLIALPTHVIYQVRPYLDNDHAIAQTTIDTLNHHSEQQQTSTISTPLVEHYWFEVRPGAEGLEQAHFVLYGCLVKIFASLLIFLLTTFLLVNMRLARLRYLKLQLSIPPSRPLKINEEGWKVVPKRKLQECNPAQCTHMGTESNSRADDAEPNGSDARIGNLYLQVPSNTGTRKSSEYCIRDVSTESGATGGSARLAQRTRQSQRATTMLIVLVISFVVTEAPQGVVNTLVAVRGECFHRTIYVPLGDILDLAVLLNSSINFILYCTMSQMFRANFTRLIVQLCPCLFASAQKLSSTIIPARDNPVGNACQAPSHTIGPLIGHGVGQGGGGGNRGATVLLTARSGGIAGQTRKDFISTPEGQTT